MIGAVKLSWTKRMQWYSKEIGEAKAVFGPTSPLQYILWNVAFFSMGTGKEIEQNISVWSSCDPQSSSVTLYFSPEGEELARGLAGFQRCEKPKGDGLGLIYGSITDWQRHFPSAFRAVPLVV
jgi:hypothetical protein